MAVKFVFQSEQYDQIYEVPVISPKGCCRIIFNLEVIEKFMLHSETRIFRGGLICCSTEMNSGKFVKNPPYKEAS